MALPSDSPETSGSQALLSQTQQEGSLKSDPWVPPPEILGRWVCGYPGDSAAGSPGLLAP